MGIPLTSQKHEGPWYTQFMFSNKNQYAALAQARVMSVYRLYDKIGTLAISDLNKIRTDFINLYG